MEMRSLWRLANLGGKMMGFLRGLFSSGDALGLMVDLAEKLFPGTKRGGEKHEFVLGIVVSILQRLDDSESIDFKVTDWNRLKGGVSSGIGGYVEIKNSTDWF
jgi:hypothetical protein